ncbi:hypothetical protein M514_02063 [Trichuris suis]|uniref:Uncharacterized protein n=1 Tax=Trichuris suis TaxID=68888 RepID=A0A085N1N3_9BILA|nr:hypothetical protein M514_02063 [Trichuris suis]
MTKSTTVPSCTLKYNGSRKSVLEFFADHDIALHENVMKRATWHKENSINFQIFVDRKKKESSRRRSGSILPARRNDASRLLSTLRRYYCSGCSNLGNRLFSNYGRRVIETLGGTRRTANERRLKVKFKNGYHTFWLHRAVSWLMECHEQVAVLQRVWPKESSAKKKLTADSQLMGPAIAAQKYGAGHPKVNLIAQSQLSHQEFAYSLSVAIAQFHAAGRCDSI